MLQQKLTQSLNNELNQNRPAHEKPFNRQKLLLLTLTKLKYLRSMIKLDYKSRDVLSMEGIESKKFLN